MPMRDSRLKLFLGSANPATAEIALQALWPLYRLAKNGRYEIAGVRIDATAAISAIAEATGRRVDSVVISASADGDAFRRPPRNGFLPFESTLGGALLKARWPAIESGLQRRFGPERSHAKDEIWRCLRRDIAEPLRLPFWDDPFEGPKAGACESVMTALFYFAAAAAAGDEDVLARLDPLVRLLAKCVPIAEDPTEPYSWMASLPPLAR